MWLNPQIITILDNDEAIVLFEFLSREENKLNTEHLSEKKVLWKILGQLEKELSEPFSDQYKIILEKSRISVQGEDI